MDKLLTMVGAWGCLETGRWLGKLIDVELFCGRRIGGTWRYAHSELQRNVTLQSERA